MLFGQLLTTIHKPEEARDFALLAEDGIDRTRQLAAKPPAAQPSLFN